MCVCFCTLGENLLSVINKEVLKNINVNNMKLSTYINIMIHNNIMV